MLALYPAVARQRTFSLMGNVALPENQAVGSCVDLQHRLPWNRHASRIDVSASSARPYVIHLIASE